MIRCSQSYSAQMMLARICELVTTMCLVALISGCGNIIPEVEPYGAVKGIDANRSPNGLGIHREMWETAGARVLFPQKLSPRLETFDVIVLVGKTHGPPGMEARRWLEDWLATEPGRTVVYFGRDFSANVYYRQQTLDDLSKEQRKAAAERLGQAQALELRKRIEEVAESTFCRWFYFDAQAQHAVFTAADLRGAWADDLVDLDGQWPVGITLREPESRWQSRVPSWISNPPTPSESDLSPQNNAATDQQSDEAITFRSTWSLSELATQQIWDEEFQDLPDFETLLLTSDGRPLVFRLSDSSKFPDSQLLVSTNGAPFLNASLVSPLHRTVGARLIEECLPATRVALLAYDDRGLTISTAPEVDKRMAGLEVLTTWPLSAITMPAALLGIVVCAVLLPILGRAKRLPPRSTSDFGLHVDALGRMLQDTGDDAYARKTIADYFRQVRGEHPPSWLELSPSADASPTDNNTTQAHSESSTNDGQPANPP